MVVSGNRKIDATVRKVWKYLMDPDVLQRVLPGISGLVYEGFDHYKVISNIKIGPVKGTFEGILEIKDKVPEKAATLVVKQTSKIGNVSAQIAMQLEADGNSTQVSYKGDAKLTGRIASMGQRVIGGVVSTLSKQFFEALTKEILAKTLNLNFMQIKVTVNGKVYESDVTPMTTLSSYLREGLGLTGTHIGCDTSGCGACTILVDGKAIKSCTMFAVQADGSDITTIEGLSQNGELHPLQASFKENHGLQCGFCTPGMIMTAVDFLKNNPDPSEHEVRRSLDGNFCRCTGYHNIVKSIQHAAESMK